MILGPIPCFPVGAKILWGCFVRGTLEANGNFPVQP